MYSSSAIWNPSNILGYDPNHSQNRFGKEHREPGASKLRLCRVILKILISAQDKTSTLITKTRATIHWLPRPKALWWHVPSKSIIMGRVAQKTERSHQHLAAILDVSGSKIRYSLLGHRDMEWFCFDFFPCLGEKFSTNFYSFKNVCNMAVSQLPLVYKLTT